ncbi:serine hydrolase [Nonomuraea jabiensis]|uniref:serine hydrolase n=1 Tax=Nonomuraea jabiensis TaxID=882448 RepID=UPI00160C99C8|nr:serine hydrolase [Nonomuraea jabiensis]
MRGLSADLVPRCAPTEHDEEAGTFRRGAVHDFSARVLGGVCGSAGVFSTVADLAKFLRHLLEPGAGSGFGPARVQESLRIHTGDLRPAWGLFWHPASGADPLDGLYRHYGFTGTGMWISLEQGRWAVLLRVDRPRTLVIAVSSCLRARRGRPRTRSRPG